MKTMSTTLGAALSLGLAVSFAYGASSEAREDNPVQVLTDAPGYCGVPSAMCLAPGEPSTVAVPSSPAASVGAHVAAWEPPRFSRYLRLCVTEGHFYWDDSVPWTLALHANLRRKALAGNAIFLVYDAEDPKVLANHEVAGVWQRTIPAGNTLSAQLTLSPDDGFHARHTYRIRVVQLVHNKEVVLSDGLVRLM